MSSDEYRKLEEVLQRSDENYRSLLDRLPLGIVVSTPHEILYYNPRALEILGLGRDDIGRIRPEDVYVDFADRRELLERLDRDGFHEYEYWLHRKDGEQILVRGRSVAIRDRQGEIIHYEGYMEDITRHHRAEENLQIGMALQRLRNEVLQMQDQEGWEKVLTAFENELRVLLDFYGCSINIADQQRESCSIYYTTSQGLEQLTGMAVPPSLLQAMETGERVYRASRAQMIRFADMMDMWDREIGSVVDVPFVSGTIAVNSPQEDAFDSRDFEILEKFSWVVSEAYRRLEDINARATAEEQFRQAQKMEAIGRLAGGVAHDFNNLLTVINGYSQLLLYDLAEDAPQRTFLEEVQKAGMQAVSLTRQLLGFSRRQVQNIEPLDLNTIVVDLEKMLHRLISDDVELVTRLDAALGQVAADEGQLQQVLLNMAINACDAMPDGGELIIQTANVRLDRPRTFEGTAIATGSYVMLSVADTGTGMDSDTQQHIFEPFFTTKEPDRGTGLGLATVYGIIRQSQGYIWVASEPGKGSTFEILLPLLTGTAQSRPESADDLAAARGAETILVVEDDAAVLRTVARILRSQGYAVLEATGGRKALQLAEQHQAVIHLLVTDVSMPEMNGRELAETLTIMHPQTRVLYMSGYAEGIIDRDGILEPGTAFLQKPIQFDTLIQKAREVLDDV